MGELVMNNACCESLFIIILSIASTMFYIAFHR